MSRFGTWLSPRHVERAYIEHVSKWITTYVAEAERQFGIPPRTVPVPQPGQFTVSREEFQKWPEEQMPTVIVLAPGLTGEPRREADRSLTAPIALAFGVVAVAPPFVGDDASAEVAQILGLCIRQIVLRLEPTNLDVKGVRLIDERYGDVETRGKASSRVIFRVDVGGWSPGTGGPIDRQNPPVDPYLDPGDYPIVQPGKIFLTLSNARRVN